MTCMYKYRVDTVLKYCCREVKSWKRETQHLIVKILLTGAEIWINQSQEITRVNNDLRLLLLEISIILCVAGEYRGKIPLSNFKLLRSLAAYPLQEKPATISSYFVKMSHSQLFQYHPHSKHVWYFTFFFIDFIRG